MKAAVLRAPKVLQLSDIATPEAAPGEAGGRQGCSTC